MSKEDDKIKRTVALVLALIFVALALAACGEDYSKHQFTFLGDDFNWDMSLEEAKTYIKKHQPLVNDVRVSEYDTWSVIQDAFYVFRFDENGKIEFVKYKCSDYTGELIDEL